MSRSYYNPSFAGETDKIRLSGVYKYEWAGLQYAPQHILLSADMPVELLGAKHGVGLITHTYSVGNERNNLLAAQYTFKYKIAKGSLNMGLQAGLQQINFDPASLRIINDSTQNNRQTIAFNGADKDLFVFHAGLSWTSKSLFIGAAASNINAPRFYAAGDSISAAGLPNDSTLSQLPTSYNFLMGYNIPVLSSLIQIQPMFFVRTNFNETQLQAALRLVYGEKHSVGVSWRGAQGYSFFAGTVIQDVQISYAYDLHRQGIGRESGGSHQVAFGYRLPIDLFKKRPQPYKSIRLL